MPLDMAGMPEGYSPMTAAPSKCSEWAVGEAFEIYQCVNHQLPLDVVGNLVAMTALALDAARETGRRDADAYKDEARTIFAENAAEIALALDAARETGRLERDSEEYRALLTRSNADYAEHTAEVARLKEQVAKVLEGFDRKIFVRNIEGDGASDWAVKCFPYLRALGILAESLPLVATEAKP